MSGTIFDKLDRPRKVVFDLDSVSLGERALGMGLQKAADQLMGPNFFIVMLWAGLSKEDKNISIKEVRKHVQKAIRAKKLTMFDLQKFILRELAKSEALTGYGPDDDEEEEEEEEDEKEKGEDESPLALPSNSESN